MTLSRIALACILTVLLARPALAAPPVGETVTSVRFQAPSSVNTGKLTQFVDVRAGQPYTRRSVRRSLELLEKLGEFSEVEAFVRPADEGVEIIFRLIPRPRLRAVQIEGNEALKTRYLLRKVNRKAGSLVEESDAEQVARAVRAAYRQEGYIRVGVRVQVVEIRPGEVDIAVEVDEGRQYTVSTIRFLGDLAYPPEELARKMKLAPGKPFSQSQLDADLRKIMRYHRDNGYLEVSSRSPVPVPNDADATVKVLVFVDSGERVEIELKGRVPRLSETLGHHLTAPVDFRPSKLHQILDLENETQFTQGFAEQGQSLLRQYYQEKGYFEVDIKSEMPEVDYARRRKQIIFEIEPGRRYKLKPADIDFVGAETVPERDLRTEFVDGAPNVLGRNRYSPEAAETARERLEKFYRSEGFESARVSRDPRTGDPVTPAVEVLPKKRRLKLAVRVEEGPRTMLSGISFVGNSRLSDGKLREIVSPIGSKREPEPLDAFLLEQKARDIETQYANRGYPDARVEIRRVDMHSAFRERLESQEGKNVVSLQFVIDEGPLVHFGKVITPDTALTQPDIVREQITIRPGDPWDGRSLSRTRRKLQRLGVFDRVEVTAFSDQQLEPVTGPDGVRLRDVRVVLLESNRMVFEPSVGLSSEKGPRIVLRFDHRNLPPGRAHKLTLRGEANWRWEGLMDSGGFKSPVDTDQLEYRLLAAYTLPTLFNSPWAGTLTGVFGETDQRRTFGVRRNQLAITASRDLGRAWHFVGQYGVGFRTILDKGFASVNDLYEGDEPVSKASFRCPEAEDGSRIPCRTADIGAEFILDRRDDRFNPHEGWLVHADAVVADRALGSQFSYVRASAGGTIYVPIAASRRLFAVLGTKVGYAVPFGATAGIPVDQRFYVGGTSTLRGFTEESVGPYVTDCDPGDSTCTDASSGGDVFSVYTVELRFPLPFDFGGVVFHDAGNAWLLGSERPNNVMNPTRLRGSVGVGLRIATPVGPAKLDYAIPIDQLDNIMLDIDPRNIDLRGRFHITIGDF